MFTRFRLILSGTLAPPLSLFLPLTESPSLYLKALPHITISSSISSTFHRRRWNIVDIVDDEPATRNDNVNDADVK